MTAPLRPETGPGDDTDRLLGAFFRAEMPDPFPSAPAVRLRPRRRRAPRSRLALAVTLGLLAGACWLASSRPVLPRPGGPDPLLSGEAHRRPVPPMPDAAMP
jgi:hypothetical protein